MAEVVVVGVVGSPFVTGALGTSLGTASVSVPFVDAPIGALLGVSG